MFRHIGESGNNLLFWGKFGALLELEVADSTRKSEVSVNASKVYKASGGTDSSLLLCYKLDCEHRG
jgi:hypothetical protein